MIRLQARDWVMASPDQNHLKDLLRRKMLPTTATTAPWVRFALLVAFLEEGFVVITLNTSLFSGGALELCYQGITLSRPSHLRPGLRN